MIGFRAVLPLVCVLANLLCFNTTAYAQFETRGSFTVFQSPRSVGVGDFNHDGKLDMAVVAYFSNQVAVLLGNGDGTFRPSVYYAVGQYPESVAVADFNGDGILDLAVANNSGISVLFGNGDGTFQPANDMGLSVFPIYVAVGDFNGDHILDLVTADEGGGCSCVSVLLGNGDGTFQPPINTEPTITPFAIGVGDFNRDGKLDVATAGQVLATSQVTVLLGNGDGTFQTGQSYSVESSPQSVAVGDFRGIGKLDLAVADFQGTGVSVLLGNGDGTFQPAVTYPTSGAIWVTTGDFNGDGKPDLAVANFGCLSNRCPPGATVFIGNGDGTFQPGTFYSAGKENWVVAVADFNGDRKPDLALADSLGEAAIVLLNTGVVSFSPTAPVNFPAQLLGTTSSPQIVTLTNTGKNTLSITSLSIQGSPFTLSSSTTCATSVAPGASCQMVVTFQPQTKGSKSGLLSIVDSASRKAQVIELFGAGTIVSLSPAQLNFPPTKAGTMSAPQTVTLTNTGSTALDITSVQLAGRWPIDYSQTNTCGSQIAPGANCTISVTFAPLGKGSWSATVSITDDGGGSPQTVPLTGTGT